ncbi:MAG: polyprenyl synthetase family protein [Candidatus Omnitrophica bacterium]|nr:polyprenyl synthetase family protein [Candidatus Omnitrophota bacterium]
MIDATKKQIDRHLVAFLQKARKEYPFQKVHPILFESILDFCARPGKRIRPLLMALSYQGYGRKRQTPKNFYTACGCLELLHNFMLIHDDIIDCSNLRRGKPTIHKILAKTISARKDEKLGENLAIVAGDIVYALAMDAFLTVSEDPARKEAALKYFIQTAGVTALGEFVDIIHGFEQIDRIKEKDVFLNYSLKTARYTFQCPLIMGALLAGAPQRDLKALSKIGLMVGQAFQIQDDMIGIFSTEKKIGKSILSDIEESKKTILVAHAYRHLKGKKKQDFLKIFKKPKKTYQDLIMIRKIFVESGSLSYSLKKINFLLSESCQTLHSLHMKPNFKKTIWEAFTTLFMQSHNIKKGIKD